MRRIYAAIIEVDEQECADPDEMVQGFLGAKIGGILLSSISPGYNIGGHDRVQAAIIGISTSRGVNIARVHIHPGHPAIRLVKPGSQTPKD